MNPWSFKTLVLLSTLCFLHACSPGEQPVIEPEDTTRTTMAAPGSPVGQEDPESGLVIDDNWMLVKANCSACHSTRLVTQNRGSRQNWLDMIRWMQESQGLWQFDAATEKGILDYLEKNYAPSAKHRRAPLAASQLPANPYSGKQDP